MLQNISRVFSCIFAVCFLFDGFSLANAAAPDPNAIIGTWYSPWYALKGNIYWCTLNHSPKVILFGDVTGDGRDDAVTVTNGIWTVYESTGKLFSNGRVWISRFGDQPGEIPMLGDVNGDGRQDAIVFNPATGVWRVAMTNDKGSRFLSPTTWVEGDGFGKGSTKVFAADVVGDGKVSPVAFYANTGDWMVWGNRKSSVWIQDFGEGSSAQMLGDINGDGKADAVTFYKNTGNWMAALSTGESFGALETFKTDFGKGSDAQFIYDVNGDGKADAIYFDPTLNNSWNLSLNDSSQAQPWKWGEYGKGSEWQWICDPYGSHKVGIAVYNKSDRILRVLPGSDKYPKPNVYNSWQAWNLPYLPLTLGKFQQYDCINPKVLLDHIKMLTDAGVNFLITDETNGIHVDFNYIYLRDMELGRCLALWNKHHPNHKLYRSFAIGGCNYTHNPMTIEQEAEDVWRNVVSKEGRNVYFYLDGKPLLVVYTYLAMKKEWEASSIDKTYANKFTIRWAEGPDHPGYYGWFSPVGGAYPDKEGMFISPRKMVTATDMWGRDENYYISEWQKVLRVRPKVVVVGDFNDYAENNWWAPTDTHLLPMPTATNNHLVRSLDNAGKMDPYLYWKITVTYIQSLRTGNPVHKDWR